MKDKIKQYLPFIAVNAAVTLANSVITESVRWGAEALKSKFGPKPKEEKKTDGA